MESLLLLSLLHVNSFLQSEIIHVSVLCVCLFARPEAKVQRLMDSGYGAPRGRFQRGGFGYRGGSNAVGRGWSGGRQSLFRGSASNSFGTSSGFGMGRGMRPFGAGEGPRQPGFDNGASGFGNWGRGRARGGSFESGDWSGGMGSGSAGMFGSVNNSSTGFGSAQFGSMAGSGRGRGFPPSYYDNTSGQYGQ